MSCPCGCGQPWPTEAKTFNCPQCGHAAECAEYNQLAESLHQAETARDMWVGEVEALKKLAEIERQQLRERIEQLPQCWSLPSSSHLQDKCVRLSDVLKILNSQQEKAGETICIHGNNRPLECKQCRVNSQQEGS